MPLNTSNVLIDPKWGIEQQDDVMREHSAVFIAHFNVTYINTPPEKSRHTLAADIQRLARERLNSTGNPSQRIGGTNNSSV